jgi:peptidoglycan/xylan/chitin deacetylase (PgdA/CDA1 family)
MTGIISCALLLAAAPASAAASPSSSWIGSWASAQEVPEPNNALSDADLTDATLRQVVRLSAGGERLRVRLSNAFGGAPLRITAAHVARPVAPGRAAVEPGSDRVLTFGGSAEATIPAGAEIWSDPVDVRAAPGSALAVSLYLPVAPPRQTSHPGARATSFLVHGDRTAAADLPDAKSVEHWFFLSGVDVLAAPGVGAVVALGDSITDGHGATVDGDNRWPDVLAARLRDAAGGAGTGVLNVGIGGNRVLQDGLGPDALARFDRDVLAQSGVRAVIVFEGVNDLGVLTRDGPAPGARHAQMVRDLELAYAQMIEAAHAHGLKILGATITPYGASGYYHPGPESEADRQQVNAWIRAPGHFDGVIDFDGVLHDPSRPDHLLAAYDSGDGLHPSLAGYRALAAAVPLEALQAQPQAAPPSPPALPAPEVAITFDDLPVHGPLPPGETRLEVAQKIISALRAAGAPPIYGFVNGVRLEQEPASAPVLDAWRAAGFPLGNHTWSHPNLNALSVEAYDAEIARNEPLLQEKMGEGDWRWFRYPFLAEGEPPEKRAAIRAFLADRGYRVAAVTMSFSDYAYNEPYVRCMAKGDDATIARMEAAWLEGAAHALDVDRTLSTAIYGREIPYVLLMHVGAFDARMLPRLLELYRARGVRLVTLPEAERDPFYRSAIDLRGPAARLIAPPNPDLSWLDKACR